jgi:hypothetical protein
MNIVISGASNTNGPWPTWATIIQERYSANWHDVSQKGMGNEAIILRALKKAWEIKNHDPITILLMLTSIDKWDWYIDNSVLLEKFNREKHGITKLSKNSPGGFWCTGSWFPLDKELFKEKYYNEDYFTLRSLQLISMFRQICTEQHWDYHIMFDSPIWAMTEQELNQGTYINLQPRLIKTDLCQWIYQTSNTCNNILESGLIGFLHQKSLPWFSQKYKAHPGPLSHLIFSKEYLYPILDRSLKQQKDDQQIDNMIQRMDTLWTP